MKTIFENPFEYKLIYIFKIDDESHKGCLKIGDTSINADNLEELVPSCEKLNDAANKRISIYTNTAGISYELLYTELAIKKDGNNLRAFRDYDVHDVLKNSNIENVKIGDTTGSEWFRTDLVTAIKAIQTVKNGKKNLSDTISEVHIPIIFRPEQKSAIKKTKDYFKKHNKMLWNAKMRFGKTLSTLKLIRDLKFKKSIIITHRPVVDKGWYEDFVKIFNDTDEYIYGSKNSGYSSISEIEKQNKNFIYFASIQDLRGSSLVGGNHDKNEDVYSTKWDFIIVDEAHEGTKTNLGQVVKELLIDNYHTKVLELSGTPFNLLEDYNDSDSIYTWDYIMEQRSKKEWDCLHFGDSNPYEELPQLKMFTYHLGEILNTKNYVDIEDKAFNFKEFFRIKANTTTPEFVHEEDVLSFLNLMTKENSDNLYPFSTKEYRALFKHSFWLIPGVKEAQALSKMLQEHPVFHSFKIVNIAGDGDPDDMTDEALNSVEKAIKENEYTITLSCGKLTTGTTIPQWTAVFMLSGTYTVSAARYLQTIFRVQNPCNINGQIKKYGYVFDFAPDRTLKMVADAVSFTPGIGKTKDGQKQLLGEFLNYCPVISISGSKMSNYDVQGMLEQLKRASIEKTVKNGFEDARLYNDELLKLTDIELKKFEDLKKIVGSSNPSKITNEIDVNNQGLTVEEREIADIVNKKLKNERTPEEQAVLDKLKAQKTQRDKAISILRAISVRLPLLIYGAEIDFEKDIRITDLLDDTIIDRESWDEFMPANVTKELFEEFIKYYDEDIFTGASRKIRDIVKSAEDLLPMERVIKIAHLFKCFKNPDKETVLTPWRVVNMHLGDCLGGYSFLSEDKDDTVDIPKFIDKGRVTIDTVAKDSAKILEINSKTGLYPLYVAYSIFKTKCQKYCENDLTNGLQMHLWKETIEKNIFVISKTPMAKQITKRTLAGYKDIRVNVHYFEDLINQMRYNPIQFQESILNSSYWNIEGESEMEFDAIIGNPPYQEETSGYGKQATPVYQYFVQQAKKLNTKYISMIMPSRWFTGGMGLDSFREEMLNDDRIRVVFDYPDSHDCFKNVDVPGGICYFLWNEKERGDCTFTTKINEKEYTSKRTLNEHPIFIRDIQGLSIVNKIKSLNINNGKTLSEVVSPQKPFGLPTNYSPKSNGIPCWFIQRIGKKFASAKDIIDTNNYLNKWKFIVPRSPIAGQTNFSKPVGFYYDGNTQIAKPGECCTESFIILGAFDTEEEVLSYKTYIFTKTVRFLLLQTVISQDVLRKRFCFIPALERYEGVYTDEKLQQMWNLSDDEMRYIDSRICNIKNKNAEEL